MQKFDISSLFLTFFRISVFVMASMSAANSEMNIECCGTDLPGASDQCVRDMAIWELPIYQICHPPSGRPISYGRLLENAIVKVKPYGYVKLEGYWDTRQPLGSREEQAFLYPAPRQLDIFGEDINARGKWDMLAIESRIGITLIGPEWGDIKTDGLIEGDFRGSIETVISDFRLRHALGTIHWKTGSFLFGQWWHPLFIIECFAHTVSFNVGAPMDPQARYAQLKVTQRWDLPTWGCIKKSWFELIAAACCQRDFTSPGPFGPSTFYMREALVPNLHLQMRAYFDDDVVGMAADYKRLAPRIVTDKNVKACEFINSFIWEAFAAFNHAPWSLRTKVLWAQNGTDQILISGYGVRTRDPVLDTRTYSNTAAAAAWLDFSYIFGCDNKELGFFVGGTKNLGSRHALYIDPVTGLPIIYALTGIAQNLDYEVRFSPRFVYAKDPIRFGLELEYSRASWGTPNRFGRVVNGCPVDNFRLLFALYYIF